MITYFDYERRDAFERRLYSSQRITEMIMRNAQGGKSSMEIREKIDRLMTEIDDYKVAQRNVEDALSSAEMELDEILDEEYRSNSNNE